MTDLRQLGARAHLFDEDGDDLGFCHLPWPLSVGDLATVEDATYRVVDFAELRDGAIDVLAVVEPVR